MVSVWHYSCPKDWRETRIQESAMLISMQGQSMFAGGADVTNFRAGQITSLKSESGENGNCQVMAELKLSHTPAEHQLYQVLLNETKLARTRVCAFSTRQLMALAQLPNYSSVRRALHGLINKLSIEEYQVIGDLTGKRKSTV